MAIEELIVAWSRERPAWQRGVMRRVAAGEVLTDEDIDTLVDEIVEGKEPAVPQFGLEDLPQAAPEDLPVSLVAIETCEHVNALESKGPLTFEPKGLTIVYGDNGSGKSGYARLLKRIARARHHEDVLTDVFRDTSVARPTAVLSVRIGATEEPLAWPTSSRPALQRMLFYDSACGSAYIASESDFPYRPSALVVMDGLIDACVKVRTRIDARLTENAASANQIPVIPEQAREGDAGKFLASLSGWSSVTALDALITRFDGAGESIEELLDQEAQLRSVDTNQARQRLIRQHEKLLGLCNHFRILGAALGPAALADVQQRQDAVRTLEGSADLLARSFESEPVPGIGGPSWKALWEAAQRFSMEHVYPDQTFPYLGKDCLCVLCQQALGLQSRDRFVRFDEFVRNDTQLRLQDAKRAYDKRVRTLKDLTIYPEIVSSNLADLEATHQDLVLELREVLTRYQAAIEDLYVALSKGETPRLEIDPASFIAKLTEASDAARAAAEELGVPGGVQRQLAALAARRANLELVQQIKESRPILLQEIRRKWQRQALETAKSAAATTGITKKILELSEESITEVVRDAFTRETERLRLERVTIARTRADKGALLHQPKLVGARQEVTLPKVLSEGERTALGLAAFFTEAQLDGSQSALILDDPVTSLDHIRRGLVATRLAALAENRQVILFTHDVAFVADLRLEAKARGVLVAERSVTRSRADERKPGACTMKHPWKAKDVPARLDDLRRELGRITKDSGTWDEKQYEDSVASWAGGLSETWERIFSQEVVGPVLAEGGLEVRPLMVRVLARFSDQDYREFDASYGRVSQWAKRHDKSAAVNFVAPDIEKLDAELHLVDAWFRRVKGYRT